MDPDSPIVAFILNEGQWMMLSMGLALLVVLPTAIGWRRRGATTRSTTGLAMNLFFAVTVASMAFGHLFAVSTKLALGTLGDRWLLYYGIGAVLALPTWWLLAHVAARVRGGDELGRRAVVLNLWCAATLLALGLHNLPLAVPGLLNVGFAWGSRRRFAWVLAGLALVIHAGLFVGSLVFLASGQTFEEFTR